MCMSMCSPTGLARPAVCMRAVEQRPAAMVQQRVSKKDPWTDTTSGQNTARRRGFRGAGSLPLTQCDQKVQSVGCALT